MRDARRSAAARRVGAGVALLAALASAAVSAAVYKWVDERGVTHYSSQKPPGRDAGPLKLPPGDAGRPGAAPSWQEQDAEFRRRRVDAELADQRAQHEKAQAVERTRECERARSHLAALESGRRVYRTNAAGEREYLDDAARAPVVENARRAVAARCG